ncbi:hypothetical protein [Agromyces sp. LHK192]|uniref:hypothetical protein n=1 Tax=Agromyces sp. LHK192 TaxID=2498704 RepID=UPI000FD7DEE5|nr:hypothetical protein [Agromyces sp. LHK192]
MPESTNRHGDQSALNTGEAIRVVELEREVERLRGELDRRAEDDLRTWIRAVRDEDRILRDMQQTLSWRITRPLRLARVVQLKVAQVGVVRTSQLAVADLRRRYAGRRR